MNEFGEKILQSIDMDANVMEHHGIKGQRWGVRRTPSELGYLEPRKTSFSERRKQKILNNPRLFYKYKNNFTNEEVKQALQRFKMNEKILQAANTEKIEKNRLKNERRREQAQEREIREERKSKERMHKLEEKTKLKIQLEKDKAQAEREKANRKAQQEEQRKKGKTLTARLAKTGALLKSVITVSTLGQQLASDMGFSVDKDKKTLLSGLFNKKKSEDNKETNESKSSKSSKDTSGSEGSRGSKDISGSESSKGSKSSKDTNGSESSSGSKDTSRSEGSKSSKDTSGSESSNGSKDIKDTSRSEGSKETTQQEVQRLTNAINDYKKYTVNQQDINAVVNLNANKLARLMAQQPSEPKVTYSNLMAVMSSKEQQDFIKSFRKSEKMQRTIRHDDMEEIEAGETEDAE